MSFHRMKFFAVACLVGGLLSPPTGQGAGFTISTEVVTGSNAGFVVSRSPGDSSVSVVDVDLIASGPGDVNPYECPDHNPYDGYSCEALKAKLKELEMSRDRVRTRIAQLDRQIARLDREIAEQERLFRESGCREDISFFDLTPACQAISRKIFGLNMERDGAVSLRSIMQEVLDHFLCRVGLVQKAMEAKGCK
ncbi:MAG: hypothetical protein AB7P04_06235 [Bacteriovoracia bacterium]